LAASIECPGREGSDNWLSVALAGFFASVFVESDSRDSTFRIATDLSDPAPDTVRSAFDPADAPPSCVSGFNCKFVPTVEVEIVPDEPPPTSASVELASKLPCLSTVPASFTPSALVTSEASNDCHPERKLPVPKADPLAAPPAIEGERP
jgi:hypothetical protein